MRPTCTFCARKHLAQAAILVGEAAMGYPEHLWLAIGHMAEAAEELIASFPEMANEIRGHRKQLEQGGTAPFLELITAVGKLSGAKPTGPEFVTGMSHANRQAVDALGKVFDVPREQIVPWVEEHGHKPIDIADPTFVGITTKPRSLTEAERRSLSEMVQRAKEQGKLTTAVDVPHDPNAPKPPAPAPCLTCGDKTLLTKAAAALNGDTKPRIAILTTLADFSPSYSLVSVILEQAHAAVLAGYRVILLVHRGANMTECPPMPPEITVLPIVPTHGWRDDTIEPKAVQGFYDAMYEWFQVLAPKPPTGPLTIITHDLLFQASYVSFAKAIHEYAFMTQSMMRPHLEWFHMAHSSIGERPYCVAPGSPALVDVPNFEQAKARFYRCTLPPGHRLIALNYADVPYFRKYYHIDADGSGKHVPLPASMVCTLLNSKDVRPYLRMTERASRVTTRYQLHRSDVTMIYPLSLMRAIDKGVDKVLALIGALKRQLGLVGSIRLLLIVAHANDQVQAPKIIARIKEMAKANGLVMDEDVILSCEAEPDTAAYGFPADDVRSLWGVANLFIFPSISEAGSLVLMEAALAGVTLVLNQSLPALADYVQADEALWVSWGSIKQPGTPLAPGQLDVLAGRVLERMSKNTGMLLRRRMMAERSLEGYGQALHEILSPSVPETDEEEDAPANTEASNDRDEPA